MTDKQQGPNRSDRLRDQIAAIIDREVDGDWEPLAVAEVLIVELGLRPEHGQRSNPDGPLWGSDNRHTVTRWVTDWKADEADDE